MRWSFIGDSYPPFGDQYSVGKNSEWRQQCFSLT